MKDLAPTVNVVALPDGTSFHDDGTSGPESRANWGIEAGRKVALMFGVINSRKGLFQVLKSLDLLPRSVQQQLALVLTGSISKEERTEALDMITAGRQTSQVQIVVDNRVVEDGEIQGFVRGADFCLVTYQRHVGSSNVLIRSAAEGKPVLGSDFGLVGENIRRHGLGLAIDTTSPECVAEAIRRFVESPESIPFDAGAAVRFARANSAERFAETIFEHTLAR